MEHFEKHWFQRDCEESRYFFWQPWFRLFIDFYNDGARGLRQFQQPSIPFISCWEGSQSVICICFHSVIDYVRKLFFCLILAWKLDKLCCRYLCWDVFLNDIFALLEMLCDSNLFSFSFIGELARYILFLTFCFFVEVHTHYLWNYICVI